MMRAIISASLRFRYLVAALGISLVYFGAMRVNELPVDVFPEFAPPRVEIQTICLGLSPAEVESLVTVPLENALAGVPGVDVMRSKSVDQLSSVLLIFKPSVDELQVRQLVTERVAIVTSTLPTWAAPPHMMPPLSATSRVMKIGITSKDKSVMDLSMLAYWNIRNKLLGVPGVANVAIWGEQLKMLMIEVDPERLARFNVTLDEVQEVVSDALDVGLLRYSGGAHIGTGGFLETPNQRMSLRFISTGVTPETLARVPVETRDGKPLLLGEVADLVWGAPGAVGDAIINDGPGLMLIVEKFPWGNTVAVTKGVEAALEAMRPGLTGIEIDTTIFRPATFVEDSIDNLSHALLLGCILVALVIIVFLYEWRTAIVCIAAIPLSLLAVAKRILLLAQGQADRGAGQIEAFAQAVDEIAPVGVRDRVGAAREQHESRRAALRLGDVIEPDRPAGHRRRRMRGGDLGEPTVERTRSRAPVPHLVRVDDRLHQPVEPLAGQPGDCDDRHALDLRQPMVGLFAQLLDGAGGVLDQVPLVHADDQSAPLALDKIGDAKILFLERPLRVDEQHHHFGKAHGIERIGDREFFELLLDPGATAHPRGVVNAEAAVLPGDLDGDGVAGDAGLGPGQQSVLAQQPIDQRRFPRIGTADHGNADGVLRRGLAAVVIA